VNRSLVNTVICLTHGDQVTYMHVYEE